MAKNEKNADRESLIALCVRVVLTVGNFKRGTAAKDKLVPAICEYANIRTPDGTREDRIPALSPIFRDAFAAAGVPDAVIRKAAKAKGGGLNGNGGASIVHLMNDADKHTAAGVIVDMLLDGLQASATGSAAVEGVADWH